VSLFDTRMTFEIAALLVTWIAIVFLALIAVSLHLRVLNLERERASSRKATPYSHLIGKSVDEILSQRAPAPVDVVLLVTSQCQMCERIVDEIASPAWTKSTAVAWIDGSAPARPSRSNVVVVDDGPAISRRLGVRVTPFALFAGPDGTIVRAGPINSLQEDGRSDGDAAAVSLGRYVTSS
jgi:hypothetical protein